MHDAGAPAATILHPVEIEVPWEELEASASGLKSASSDVASAMTDAGSSWAGLTDAYRQPGTQEAVWAAMDDAPGVVEDWADVMGSAVQILRDFIDEGKPLQTRCESLKEQATNLQMRLAASNLVDTLLPGSSSGEGEADGDAALRQDIAEHNAAVLNLNQDWNALESRVAGDLSALHGSSGRDSEIPSVSVPGTGTPTTPAGAVSPEFELGNIILSADLSASGQSPDPDEVLEEIYDEDGYDGDWGAWAADNPELAAEFSDNQLTSEDQLPEGAEGLYELAEGDNTDPANIDAVAEIWEGLGDEEQQALLLMFPTVFGNLNGVAFQHRGNANAVRVFGEQHNLQQAREEQEQAVPEGRPNSTLDEMDEVLKGLDDAADALQGDDDFTVLQLDTSETGQIVAMQGHIHDETESVHATVPGSEVSLEDLEDGMGNLSEVTDPENDATAGIYFQGWDTPDSALGSNNVLADPNAYQVKAGASALAGFDHALDNEIEVQTGNAEQVRTAYTGHSAGGVMLATASTKEYGLDADSMTLLGSVGSGVGLEDRSDLANEDMEIYYLETRSDIAATGRAAMPQYSENFGTDYHDQMESLGAQRLETGLTDAEIDTPEGKTQNGLQLLEEGEPWGGHTIYYAGDSLSTQNIQAAAEGAEENQVYYVDAQEHITSSFVDRGPDRGTTYHFEFGNHRKSFDTMQQAEIYAIEYISSINDQGELPNGSPLGGGS